MSHTTSETITLWGLGQSPYVRKVQIALEEKKLAYEQKQILPKVLLVATQQAVPDAFQKASPLGKIPALEVGSFSISDSSVICAYLDKKFPQGHKLYPEDADAYARARWFENYADTTFSNVIYQKIFFEAAVKPIVFKTQPNTEMVEQAKSGELPPLLDYLESEASKAEWLAGPDFSIADVAVVTHLISAEQAGFFLDQNRWKALAKLKEKVMARESFKKIQ